MNETPIITQEEYDEVEASGNISWQGKPLAKLPEDLYIPPDALRIFLEAFEGPLDLLWYLIKKNNLSILDIPIAEITRQYMGYIELMEDMKFELAAEYLVMAAMLAEIKSKMLLPKSENETEDEEDPRAELVRRLQEYELYKSAALLLDHLPRRGRDTYPANAAVKDVELKKVLPEADLTELVTAFKEVLKRASLNNAHQIKAELLSVRERVSHIISKLRNKKFIPFAELFTFAEGRLGAVVTFIAILELFKNAAIEVIQAEPFAPIYIRAAGEE